MSNTFLLIHGAWHGKWCFKEIIPLLTLKGHEVIAIDLPGHGENKMDFSRINLASYVHAVIDTLKMFKKPIYLVGHSLGGVVISQVAEKMPKHIHKLIYIAGFLPENGYSLTDEVQRSLPIINSAPTFHADKLKNEITIQPDAEKIQAYFYNCSPEISVDFALKHLQPQPFQPFLDKVSLSHRFLRVKKLYIECLRDHVVQIEDQRRMYQKVNCDVATLDTDHSPFFSKPEDLVHFLCL